MITLQIQIENPQNADILLSLLRSVSFITTIDVQSSNKKEQVLLCSQPDKKAKPEKLRGMWKGRNINQAQLRELAWGNRI